MNEKRMKRTGRRFARLSGCLLIGFASFSGGAETIRITDDFNRADTDYQTPEHIPNAIGSNYTVTSGQWRIRDNELVSNVNPSRMYENTLQTLNTGTDRFVLSADVKVRDGKGYYGGIMCNVQDGLNYYALRYSVEGSVAVLQFIRTVGGANTAIGPGSLFLTNAINENAYYTLTVASSNSTFHFSISEVNGAEIASGTATDSTFAGGYSGFLRQGGGGVWIDNFSIESTAEAVEQRVIQFAAGFTNGMVLRSDYNNLISGTAPPDETVTIEVSSQSKAVAADSNGNWQVLLDPEFPGGPYRMTAAGASSSPATLTEVYFDQLPIEPAAIFSSGCVLQRDHPVVIWGGGAPGETITVQIKDQSKTAVVDGNGNWQVALEPEPAGGPYTLTISASISLSVEFTEVYFGDVWILTGQSNMFQTLVGQVSSFPDEYPVVPNETDDFDDLRLAIVAVASDLSAPRDDVTMQVPWSRWQPDALPNMSTVGYFFARYLKEQMDANGLADVPLGIIKVCKGGTSIEEWISKEKLVASGLPVPSDASGYYNGMIAPIQNYAITGALWYQGEGNSTSIGKISRYPAFKEVLVDSWREQWAHPELPLYFVQLAPYHAHSAVLNDGDLWPWMREAQLQCLSLPNTAMACIIDGGLQGDIHPPFKDRVGERLARIALSETYGLPFVSRGPVVQEVQVDGSDVIITFDHVAEGLRTQAVDAQDDADEIAAGFRPVSVSSNELAGFALCGSDRTFYWATQAEIISSNQVRISNAADVPAPVSVRYAWQNYPRCNLFNSEGLPAEPFRTDDYGYNTSTAADSTPGARGIPDQATHPEKTTIEIDLSKAFIDIEDGAGGLVFSVTGISDEEIVAEAVVGNQALSITLSGLFGSSRITVSARDSAGNTVETVFSVIMESSAYKAWRHDYFTVDQLSDPGVEASLWGDRADPDGDGVPNLLEYALGRNPLEADPESSPLFIVMEDGEIKVRFVRSKQAAADSSLSVGLQKIADLNGGGAWMPVVSGDSLHQDLGKTELREVILSSEENEENALFIRVYASRSEG